MAKPNESPPNNSLDLFLRVWGREKMTRAKAREVLRMKFTAGEEARVHELMEKNRWGKLTADEERELDAYVQVWAVVSALQSRARVFLKQPTGVRAGRG
jgi:hypothetical protein